LGGIKCRLFLFKYFKKHIISFMDINLWKEIESEVRLRIDAEPTLGPFLNSLVLSQKDLLAAVASILASKLHSDALSAKDIKKFILEVYRDCKEIEPALEADLRFFKQNDPACKYLSTPLLFYKGFLGLATYRAAHCLWNGERHTMALFLQNRASEVFGVDIHPAATIAGGVMIDHATGVVIGETSDIEKGVSIFQGVTLGGKGFESGKRHPNIKQGATVFAASTVLGNITVGRNSIVAAGSLVLHNVDDNKTVAGVPAKETN
jgi:serine O-acetyltransferase